MGGARGQDEVLLARGHEVEHAPVQVLVREVAEALVAVRRRHGGGGRRRGRRLGDALGQSVRPRQHVTTIAVQVHDLGQRAALDAQLHTVGSLVVALPRVPRHELVGHARGEGQVAAHLSHNDGGLDVSNPDLHQGPEGRVLVPDGDRLARAGLVGAVDEGVRERRVRRGLVRLGLVQAGRGRPLDQHRHLGGGRGLRPEEHGLVGDLHGEVGVVDERPGALHPARLHVALERLEVRVAEQTAVPQVARAPVAALGPGLRGLGGRHRRGSVGARRRGRQRRPPVLPRDARRRPRLLLESFSAFEYRLQVDQHGVGRVVVEVAPARPPDVVHADAEVVEHAAVRGRALGARQPAALQGLVVGPRARVQVAHRAMAVPQRCCEVDEQHEQGQPERPRVGGGGGSQGRRGRGRVRGRGGPLPHHAALISAP